MSFIGLCPSFLKGRWIFPRPTLKIDIDNNSRPNSGTEKSNSVKQNTRQCFTYTKTYSTAPDAKYQWDGNGIRRTCVGYQCADIACCKSTSMIGCASHQNCLIYSARLNSGKINPISPENGEVVRSYALFSQKNLILLAAEKEEFLFQGSTPLLLFLSWIRHQWSTPTEILTLHGRIMIMIRVNNNIALGWQYKHDTVRFGDNQHNYSLTVLC